MKHSQEEILKALRVIKETCKEYGSCSPCPFSRNGSCVITNVSPHNWRINEDSIVFWKGLL